MTRIPDFGAIPFADATVPPAGAAPEPWLKRLQFDVVYKF